MTQPTWVAIIQDEPRVVHGFLNYIGEQIIKLHRQAAEDAKDFEQVLLVRGGLQQLRLLQKLLEHEESDNARRTYERRTDPSRE